MHKMEELRDMLCDELDKITSKGELSAGSLDIVDKLTHSIKSIDTIIAMEDAGYSNESGYSYARGRGRYAKRDSMGRYSNRGYSRDDAREDLAMELKEIKRDTKDPEMSRMIDHWMKQLEQG